MYPTSVAPTSITSHPFELPATSPTVFNQSASIATMNLMPTASYSSVAVTGNSMQNAIFAPAVLSQHQQPIMFPGNAGGFFLTQSAASIGTAPVMLAPGQSPAPGAFVVAQPVPGAAPSPTNSAPIMATTAATGCIIRLPDGRLVMSTQAPTSMNIHTPNMPRLSGGQPAYFPISVPSHPLPTVTLNQPQPPPQQQQQSVGMLAPSSGQAFYIQVPPNPGGFGGTVIATTCTTASVSLPPHSTAVVKPSQSVPCANPITVANRHPILVSSPVPGLQNQGVLSPKIDTQNSLGIPTVLNRPGLGIQNVQSQPNLCSSGGPPNQTSNLQPGGITVARLPTGSYAAVPYTRPQSPTVPVNSTPSTGSNGPVKSSTRRNASNSRSSKHGTSTATVLQRLDEQITVLQGLANLSEAQATRLKQLIDVRQQLSKTSKSDSSDLGNRSVSNSGGPMATSDTVSISLALRRELLDLLSRNSLLPRIAQSSNVETFVVEFRLNQQRYQLRLTKQQKIDIERLLFSVTSQRQAEILTVLHQEQSRLNSTRIRLPTATTAASTCAASMASMAASQNFALSVPTPSVRLQPPMHSYTPVPTLQMHPATFGGAQGLRLVATRQMLPSPSLSNAMVRGGPVSMVPTAPVMGVVTALAMSPMSAQVSTTPIFAQNIGSALPTAAVAHSMPNISGPNSQAASGIFLSSSIPPGTQTFVMQQPVMVPSCSMGATVLPVSTGVVPQTQVPQPSSVDAPFCQPVSTLPSLPVVTSQPLRSTIASSKQASRMSRIRTYLVHDLKCAVERPPQKSDTTSVPPSPLELLEILAPYHIQQDADNTKEALLKVDQILGNTSLYLLERKRRVVEAIHAQLYKDSMSQMMNYLEDRLVLEHMALDLERDVFEAEKRAFRECTEDIDEMKMSSHDISLAQPRPASHDLILATTNSENATDNHATLLSDRLCEVRRQEPNEPLYLRHRSSTLPTPWSKSLGSLATLRPLVFDRHGNASSASIELPSFSTDTTTPLATTNGDWTEVDSVVFSTQPFNESTAQDNESTPVMKSVSDAFNSVSCDTIDDSNVVNEGSADEAEADLLLGLDVRPIRANSNERMINTNGILHSRAACSAEMNQSCGESGAFDETYDLWQELMQEEGMELEEMESDSCLKSTSTSNLLPDDSSKKSSLLFENGSIEQLPQVQHSEDPDIDAAIRSILSTTN